MFEEGFSIPDNATLLFSKEKAIQANYYIENEYVIEPSSYCLSRIIVPLTSYVILHLDPRIASLFPIEDIQPLEPGRFFNDKLNCEL